MWGMCLFWFSVAYELQVVSYSTTSKLPSNTHHFFVWTLTGLLFTYTGCGMHNQATPELLNACITNYNKFATCSDQL